MFRLAAILYSMIATSVAGTLIIAALTMGYDTLVPIVVVSAVGFVVSIPVTWWITKQITSKIV